MRNYSGLEKLRTTGYGSVLCPKCGNYLEPVNNGFLGGQLYFCKKQQLVFMIELKDISKKANKEVIESYEKLSRLRAIKKEITYKNIDQVEALIKETQ